ncbi:histidine kinase HHK3 [Penicillium odoratum]|uniref:histidine kinase HHK3 n=1 Tax=Penicillium odoratum TaxID=1167516 RepID=UPI0025498B50|nr:histidine kinase HHK3 [Penicillium odoratum]KAJ5776868.1 histidine kinase HHK3 [Penicillium odoratum]
MVSDSGRRLPFFPKADAAILKSKYAPPPTRPQTVGPIYDRENVDRPIEPWSSDVEKNFYPKSDPCAPAAIPKRPSWFTDRYLRAFLAENERLRLSMLWYYTRDISKEDEFLSGLQEKACLAQESTGWEFAVIGILDVNVYIRLATVGLELGILPRGETICAHTVTQPPGSVFLLPSLMEDWRFQESPYLELGGLYAYAGVPLRLQDESGHCVGLGSLCVASSTSENPLTSSQQQALVRLADWVVSDLVQCTRARRQRERRQMSDLLSRAQKETDHTVSEEPILKILRNTYQNAIISLQPPQTTYIEIEGHGSIPIHDLEDGIWEDNDYFDELIAHSNHLAPSSNRVVRIITAPCESVSGSSLLVVASKDIHLVFDDIDSWFVQTCAGLLSQMWRKSLLIEAMKAKERFLQGFSHQLRTPIHGILGSVELLAEELQSGSVSESVLPASVSEKEPSTTDSREPSTYLNIIKMAGQDLSSIVNNMITLNRWADIAIADRQYALHTVDELESEIQKEIAKLISEDTRCRPSICFTHDVPPGFEGLRTDLGVLRDTLIPLILNSIQNTAGGTVSITVSIRLGCKDLVFDIKDTGRGIPIDHHQCIFEPYEKVDLHSAGAGLGLTLASKFATLLHGSVNLISSVVGCGSHFRATFREVELFCAPQQEQLTLNLNNLPPRFFHMTTGSECVQLRDDFTKFLTQNAFKPSDSIENCLVILNVVSDLELHRMHLAQIPMGQVAICLVPDSEGDPCLERSANNVVYVHAPLSTSDMFSALEKAHDILVGTEVLQLRPSQPNISHSRISGLCQDPDTDGPSSHPSTSDSIDFDSDSSVPPTSSPDTATSVDLTVATTIFPANTDTPKPLTLIVDDNAINLRIIEMYLKKRELPYHSAVDGQQAVEIFSRCQSSLTASKGTAIQLIFMDLQMPVCDGIEATKQIRLLEQKNHWAKSTIFMMTGQDSPSDRAAAAHAGTDEYLVKPVVIKQLDRVVKQYFPAFEIS